MNVDRERLAGLADRPHRKAPRFRNPRALPHHGLRESLRWQWQSPGMPPPRRFPLQEPDPEILHRVGEQARLT